VTRPVNESANTLQTSLTVGHNKQFIFMVNMVTLMRIRTNLRKYFSARWLYISPFLAAVILIQAGCQSPPPPSAIPPAAPPSPPSVEVYFYPAKGQSKEQQERDRYECYLWAKDQTGFDPSAPTLAPHQRVRVEPIEPTGEQAKAGAITGAVLGAVVAEPGKEAEGAVKGAIAGAIVGAASEQARVDQARRIEAQRQAQLDAAHAARLERQANNYRRAMSACLKGRGYEVR
jgi:hypothetical protein